MTRWFLNTNEDILGPFSTEEVKAKMARGLPKDCLIWGRDQKEWCTMGWWKRELPKLVEANPHHPENRKWHFAYQGQSNGPMTRTNLIKSLGKLESLQGVMLWAKGMKGWAPVYEFHDVMEDIGINRRAHPRARIKGTVAVNREDLVTIAQLQTVSEGGVGVTGFHNGVPGEEIQMEIKSPSLAESIHVKAEVRYITESGFTGFQFTQISTEAKSLLIDYIKNEALTTIQEAA